MAVESGFFNSLEILNEDGSKTYDREYYAMDFANYLVKVIGNGVFATPSDNLQILAGNDMEVIVKTGEGRIDGYWLRNTSDFTIKITEADVVLNRIDRIVMQLNHTNREINIVYKEGDLATNPVAPNLVRNEQIQEYSLARIYVGKTVTSISQSNITDTRPLENECGLIATMGQMESNNYFIQMQAFIEDFTKEKASEYETWEEAQQAAFDAWFENTKTGYNTWLENKDVVFENWFENIKDTIKATSLYREYSAIYTVQTKGEQTIAIPTSINYDNSGLDVLNIFISGMRLLKDVEYTISSDGTSIILSVGIDVVGTDIEFVNKKSVSGTAAESVVIQVENLQSDVNNLAKCSYIATGSNDNINLSNIVKNFLDGTGDYSSVADNASMKINVTGVLATDTLIENQMVFDFNSATVSNRKVIVDFGNATIPTPASPTEIQNILAIISAEGNVVIENANINISNYNATTIYGVHGGIIKNSNIKINNNTATNIYGVWGAKEVSSCDINITSSSSSVYGAYSTEKVIGNTITLENGYSVQASGKQLIMGNIINQDISKTDETVEIGTVRL